MGIKIHQNDYIAPVVERPANATNKLRDLSNALVNLTSTGAKLAKGLIDAQEKSKKEAAEQKANEEISTYNLKANMEIKKLKANGERNIGTKMEAWSDKYQKDVLDYNKDVEGFDKLWKENIHRIDNPLSLTIYEAQLEVDSVNAANDRNIQLENNITSTRLDPRQFQNNTSMSFQSVDGDNTLSYVQKLNEFNNIAMQQQTTAYLSTVDKDGVEVANEALLNGDFNFSYKDRNGQQYSYDLLKKVDKKGNPIAATLVKSAEDSDFKAILESDNLALLEATKVKFDEGKRYGEGDVYSLKGVGTIWNKEEKQHYYNQLNKAIKNKALKDQDTAQGQRVDLYIAAQNGDYVAAQSIRKMAESGDKFAKKSYKALQNSVPELCETAQEAFNGFAEKIRTLASIDVNKPASMGEMSGQTRYKTALWDALQYLEDRNHITKDLSPEDKKLWGDMVVTLNENIGQNITSLVDGLMTAKEAMNSYNIFRHTKANADVDVGALLTSVPTVSVEESGKTYSQKGFNEDRYNKKQDDFIANKYVRSVFTIESNYAGATDPVLLQRKQALLAEAKNTFLTEKRLQVAPELYWADSTSNYKIHEVGDIITINNRNYVLKGYEGLIFPLLSPEANNGR